MKKNLGIGLIFGLVGVTWGTVASGFSVTSLPENGGEQIQTTERTATIVPRHVMPESTVTAFYSNPDLGTEEEVFLHYGFNGWNLNFAGAREDRPGGNLSYFRRVPMTWDQSRQQFMAAIEVPAGARAIHYVFCWKNCAAGQWDNNNSEDYGWPITFPFIGPLLSWDTETTPDTGIVVNFESALEAEGWIEVNERFAPAQRFRSAIRNSQHSFRLTNLKPDTTYYYRVGAGRDLVSKQYSFKTVRALDRIENLSFVVMGDAQDDGENQHFAIVADAVAQQHADIDFIVSPGDLPWNDRPGDWWTFFDKGRDLLGQKVFMPTVGNHDTPGNGSDKDATSFRRYFPSLPYVSENAPYYKFSFVNVSFFMLSSEHDELMQQRGEQYRWLDEQLDLYNELRESTADSRTFWSFVMWHIPPYNAGSRHAGRQFAFRDIAQHFNSTVDWFLGGHEHLYQRSHPLNFKPFGLERKPRYGNQLGDGTGVLIVPPMGATPNTEVIRNRSRESGEILEMLAYPDRVGEQIEVDSVIGFSRFDLEGNSLALRTYGMTNEEAAEFTVVDRLNYQK